MANKKSNNTQQKNFRNIPAEPDNVFYAAVKKYRFTSITFVLLLIFFLIYYARDIFG